MACHPTGIASRFFNLTGRTALSKMAEEQKDGGDVPNLTGSNGFLLEPVHVWTLAVEIGSSGSPEMERRIRPEKSTMKGKT